MAERSVEVGKHSVLASQCVERSTLVVKSFGFERHAYSYIPTLVTNSKRGIFGQLVCSLLKDRHSDRTFYPLRTAVVGVSRVCYGRECVNLRNKHE